MFYGHLKVETEAANENHPFLYVTIVEIVCSEIICIDLNLMPHFNYLDCNENIFYVSRSVNCQTKNQWQS